MSIFTIALTLEHEAESIAGKIEEIVDAVLGTGVTLVNAQMTKPEPADSAPVNPAPAEEEAPAQ